MMMPIETPGKRDNGLMKLFSSMERLRAGDGLNSCLFRKLRRAADHRTILILMIIILRYILPKETPLGKRLGCMEVYILANAKGLII